MIRSAMAAVPPVTPAANPMLVPAEMKIIYYDVASRASTVSAGRWPAVPVLKGLYNLPIKTGTAANPPVAMVKAPPTKVRPPATTPVPEPMAFAMVLFFVTLATQQTSSIVFHLKDASKKSNLFYIGCNIP